MHDHGFGDEGFGAFGGLVQACDDVGVLPVGLGDADADLAGPEGGTGHEGAVAGYGVGLAERGVVEGEMRADGIC